MRLACATIAWNELERSPSRPTISDAADTRARIAQQSVGVVVTENESERVVLLASPKSRQVRGSGPNIAVEQARRRIKRVAQVLLRHPPLLHQTPERLAVDLDPATAQTVGKPVAPVGE